jgi:hypothetical protein
MFVIRNGLKEGDAVSPLLLNFTLEYAIKRVQVNQYGLKLNGTHQLYAYDVNTRYIGRKRTFYKEKECACTILSSEASPTLLYFTLYLINSMIIKKLLKWMFWFSLQLLSEACLILEDLWDLSKYKD